MILELIIEIINLFQVEHYMTKTFYNLASVALHDWQSYATMRVLATDKFKLSILDDHLPGHSLEQVYQTLVFLTKFYDK